MKQPLSALRAMAFAAGVTLASTPMLAAAPLRVPQLPAASSDVVTVQDSAKIVRRNKPHDGAWNRPDHRREGRREARDGRDRRDGQGRNNIYRPKATPKFAYDAQGNFRVYDRNRPMRDGRWTDGRRNWRGLEDHRRWDDNARWDDKGWDDKGQWDDKHRRRPNQFKAYSFGYQQPSPALKQVLTAVPKETDAQ